MDWMMKLPIRFTAVDLWSLAPTTSDAEHYSRDVCDDSRPSGTYGMCVTRALVCISSHSIRMAEAEKSTNLLFTKFQIFDQSTSSAWKYQFENQISIYIGVKMAFAVKRVPDFALALALCALTKSSELGVQQIEPGSLRFIRIKWK